MKATIKPRKKKGGYNLFYTFAVHLSLIFCSITVNAQMIFENYTGPVTQNEISAFKNYMQTVDAPVYEGGNIWVFGNPGKAIEACGLMYETTKDLDILDRMIYYCDAALSDRNDLASAESGGQRITWTGNIDPIWPSTSNSVTPAGAGVEQGEVLSHITFCAKLILETPTIWDNNVTIGDPKGFGATYKERALKYIEECDYVIDDWILPRFIRTSDHNRYYFPGSPNTYKPNDPAPWNQAWMITNAFVRLTQCHLMLGDDPTRVELYDSIVQPNIDWFFENLTPNTSPSGTSCWLWAYAYPSGTEDANHFAYDAQGLWIAYSTNRYGITFDELVPFANTYFDIILATVTNGKFAGRVDGSTGSGNSGGDNYVRDEYIYLTEFRPDKFETVVNIETNTNKISSSPQITARLLWERNRRFLSDTTAPEAPTELTATAISPNQINLTWTDNSDNEISFRIERSIDNGQSWAVADSIDWNLSSYSDKNVDSSTAYQYRVRAHNSHGNSDFSNTALATTPHGLPIAAPTSLTATAETDNQVDLSWKDNSDNEELFRIERSLDNGTTWDSLIVVGHDSIKYSDFEVQPSTNYQYRVRSENQYGQSNYSNTAVVETSHQIFYYRDENLVLNKTASASNVYKNNSSYNASKAVDGIYSTRWATDGSLSYYWLEIDLETNTTFNKVITSDYKETVTDYKIQYWDGNNWLDAFSDTGIGTEKEDEFPSVTGSKVRLYIDSTWSGPSIYEFEVYNEKIIFSKGKDAIASSADLNNVAKNAVDEDSSYWSAADNTYPQWWKVDLDSIQLLSAAAIDWLETDSCTYQYKIEVSNDDNNYSLAVDKTENTSVGSTSDLLNIEGRYVKVTITGCSASIPASAYEIRILGNKDSKDNVTNIEVYYNVDMLPSNFELYQNYPNPFNPSTKISYYLSEASKVKLTIYDVVGREIDTIIDDYQNAGTYNITWDTSVKHLASGTYIAKLKAGSFSKAIKLLLLK